MPHINSLDEEMKQLMELIKEKTGLTEKEIWKKIGEDRILSGPLLSRKGALILLASELGVKVRRGKTYRVPFLNIKDLVAGMQRVRLVGRIKKIYPVIWFERKNGNRGKVQRLKVIDKTGEVIFVLWGDSIKGVERAKIGDAIRIDGGRVKEDQKGKLEIHLDPSVKIELNPPELDKKRLPSVREKLLGPSEIGIETEEINLMGVITYKSKIRSFRRGGEKGEMGFLELADSHGSKRVVFWEHLDTFRKADVGDFIKIYNCKVVKRPSGGLEVHVAKSSFPIINPQDIFSSIRGHSIFKVKDLREGISRANLIVRVLCKPREDKVRMNKPLLCYDATGCISIGASSAFTGLMFFNSDECLTLSNVAVKFVNGKGRIVLDEKAVVNVSERLNRFFPRLKVLHPRVSIENMERCLEAERCEVRGTIVGLKPSAINKNLYVNLLVDDGTGQLAVNVKKDELQGLLDTLGLNMDVGSGLVSLSEKLIGRELVFYGKTRFDRFRGFYEFLNQRVVEADPLMEALLILMDEIWFSI